MGSGAQQSEVTEPLTFSFWPFFRLGVGHILHGYDHLVFLAGLLLACERARSVVYIVTAFTLAHALSLALSTFDLIRVPESLVEIAIAATIVAVGLENLLTLEEGWRRRVLAFAFGLVHGLGFASVLRSLVAEMKAGVLWLPLLSFNVGVEIGQLAAAAVIFPLLLWARSFRSFRERGRTVLSALICLLGFYWMIERLFFS